MQRPAPRSAIERACLVKRAFGIEIDPGLDGAVTGGKARNAIGHDALAVRLACGDRVGDFGGRKRIERMPDFRVHEFRLRDRAGQFLARPAVEPAILPNTVPEIRPEPPG